LFLARRADVILNINMGVKKYLMTKGFAEKSIIINPPGIDLNYLRSIPSATSDKGYDGIFLGRLNPSKGVFDLPEIWEQVVKKNPAARLGIIGGGSEEIVAQLKAIISAKNLANNITLLGYLGDQEAFAIIKASKVCLFPSHEEGFGIAIVEALACGISVVAWDLEVFGEYFSELIELSALEDIADFANKVSNQLLEKTDNQCDSELKSRIEKLDRFSWNQVSQNTLKIIN
jgi:glycosyltransferase involved in cell wall biosynthesis